MLPLFLAAGTLRITDSSRGGSSALRTAALEYSLSANGDIRIDRMSAQQAEMLIPQDTVDIAVFEIRELPEKFKNAPQLFLGAEVLLIYVNSSNPIAGVTSKEAAAIFSGQRPRWSEYGGVPRAIHRFNLKNTSDHAGLDRDLFNAPAAAEVFGLDYSGNVVQMVSANQEAMGFAHFAELVNGVRILPVDGIHPKLENVFNGTYPLARRYVLATIKKSAQAEKFIDFLKKDIKTRVRKDMWLLPEEKIIRHPADHNSKKEK